MQARLGRPGLNRGAGGGGVAVWAAGALPRALLDEAVAKASAALQSPEVDPVECLCGRSDTLVTYADMVIDADRLHSTPS